MIRAIARAKFLFDIGFAFTSQVIGIINMCLLLIAFSDKISAQVGVGAAVLAPLAVGSFFGSTLAIGWWSARFGFQRELTGAYNEHNELQQKAAEARR